MMFNAEVIEKLTEGGRRLSDDPDHILEAGLLFLAADRIREMHDHLTRLTRPAPPLDVDDECAVGGAHKKSADPASFNCIKCGEPAFKKGHAMAPTQRKPRPPAPGPRHKFVDGVCVSIHGDDGKACGKPKGKPGRPPAEPPAAGVLPGSGLPPDYRAPLAERADNFTDGGLGSSGVRR